MFLTFLSRVYKTFRFRLTLWFSLAFILISLVLFGFAYYLVSSSLQANDRTAIQLKLMEYADEYRVGSIGGIRRKINLDAGSGTLRGWMIRLASPKNETLFLKPPEEETKYEFEQLEHTEIAESGTWIRLKAATEDDVLYIASTRLADGSLLQVGKSPEEREDILDQFRNDFVTVLVAVVTLSVIGGTLLARQALRPVRGLINVLGPISDTGQTDSRIPVHRTGDEFEELELRFNQALEKIDKLVEGIRAATDNVAHDLRTPMTRLRGVAEMALQSAPNLETYCEALSDCLEESEQALRMLNMLMDISEVETGSVKLDIREVNILTLVNHACELYRGVAENKSIAVKTECPVEVSVSGDRNRLLQAMANLLDNAIKYTPAGGSVWIAVSRQKEGVVIEVQDSGVGIPSEDLSRIWNRCYRGDKSRTQRGLGLGLSLARAVIEAHKGTIDVLSDLGKGTTFIIHLPEQTIGIQRA